jgi:hypothetical protein
VNATGAVSFTSVALETQNKIKRSSLIQKYVTYNRIFFTLALGSIFSKATQGLLAINSFILTIASVSLSFFVKFGFLPL